MEKFFIVKEGSRLHTDFWEWRRSVTENNEIVKKFFAEHGIEAAQYYINTTVLGIVPTDKDKEVFEKQLTKNHQNEQGLRLFRKNSVIGKAWLSQAAGMKILHKPFPTWYNAHLIGRSSSRLFDHKGVLYCSISADNVKMQEDTFEEIKGSEFFRIIEEVEDELNV